MRLVDGVIENEGRVEVCLDGVWGTINSESGWYTYAASLVCHQLKFGSHKSESDKLFNSCIEVF